MKKPKEVPPPTPIEARKYASLDCAGNCGFVDKGVGLQCVKGDACTRMVHKDHPAYTPILFDLSRKDGEGIGGNARVGLWREDPKYKEGKYPVILRRDGTIPSWPWFIIGARDPAAPAALRAYSARAKELGMDAKWVNGVSRLADQFERYPHEVKVAGTPRVFGDPDAAPHRSDDPLVLAVARGEMSWEAIKRLVDLAKNATKYQITPVLHVERQYPGAPWQAMESSAAVDANAGFASITPLDGTDGTLASALARVDKRIAQANLKEEFPETVDEPTPTSIPDALAGAVVSKELDGLVEEILRPVAPVEVAPPPAADADDKLFDELLGHKADHEEHMKDQELAQPPVDPETPAAS